MQKANFYAACYAIIENEKGEVLFQKRVNTGFRDGAYQVPAGHIEGKETMKECLIREVKEELNIDVLENDVDIEHISHRISSDRVYFDVYLKIKNYSGVPIIAEIEKCSELKFIDINKIKDKKLFGYDLDVIEKIKDGEKFSDL